jgi:hypothetical protein
MLSAVRQCAFDGARVSTSGVDPPDLVPAFALAGPETSAAVSFRRSDDAPGEQ